MKEEKQISDAVEAIISLEALKTDEERAETS